MNETVKSGKPWHITLAVLAVALILSVAIAWEVGLGSPTTSQQAAVALATQVLSPTSLASPAATPSWQLTREAFFTEVANGDATEYAQIAPTGTSIAQTRTAVAMTPERLRPTDTPEPILPTPTQFLGILEDCCARSGYPWITTGGWIGWVNGKLISVVTGSSYHNTQGVVLVFNGGDPLVPPSILPSEVYSTPLQIGAVYVAATNGTRLTLAQDNPPYPTDTPPSSYTFVFDVVTRQFVSPLLRRQRCTDNLMHILDALGV